MFTVAGVTALSTVAMILYPPIADALGLDAHAGGRLHRRRPFTTSRRSWAPATASRPEVGDYAVLTKMLRVAMLLPVVMAFADGACTASGSPRPRQIRCCRRFCSRSSRSSSPAAWA